LVHISTFRVVFALVGWHRLPIGFEHLNPLRNSQEIGELPRQITEEAENPAIIFCDGTTSREDVEGAQEKRASC
jgi:hypothetical protein